MTTDTITEDVRDQIRQMHGEIIKLHERLEFAEWEWNRATEGMKERDVEIERLRSAIRDAHESLKAGIDELKKREIGALPIELHRAAHALYHALADDLQN